MNTAFMFGSQCFFVALVLYALYKVYNELNNSPVKDIEERNKRNFAEVVRDLLNSMDTVTASALNRLTSIVDLGEELEKTRTQLNNLKIDKSRIEEEFARKEREIEHKLGLERARQSQELELSKREAKLEVAEGNLARERKEFEDRMKFMSDRFASEVEKLQSLMMKAIPTMHIDRKEIVRDGN